jgi:hypothetical protein
MPLAVARRHLHRAALFFALILASLSLAVVSSSGSAIAASGSGWTVTPTPDPGFRYGQVHGVSCPSATFCVGVGARAYVDVQRSVPLLDSWNGKQWVTTDVALPANAFSGAWNAVSCPSPSSCLAVGVIHTTDSASDPGTPIAARWNGKVWASSLPLPGASAVLDAVACPSASSCAVVGKTVSSSGPGRTFSLTLTGESWSARETIPHPFSWYPAKAWQLNALTCRSASDCYAAGTQDAVSVAARAVVQAIPYLTHWDGTSWRLLPVPRRLDDYTNTSGTIAGMACPTATLCLLVGSAIGGTGLLQFNSAGWAKPADDSTSNASFSAISCSSATRCLATGTAAAKPIQARWDGTRWTVSPAVDGISALGCVSDGSCIGTSSNAATGVVIGYVTGPGGDGKAFPFPVPAGTGNSSLGDVSCPDGSSCTALGYAGSKPVLERWNGTSWTFLPALTSLVAEALDCPTSQLCVEVGKDYSTSPTSGASGVLQGGHWTRVAFPFSSPKALSCASATYCIAVGDNSTGQIAARFDGSSWTAIAAPGGDIDSIDCPTVTFCMAVGSAGTSTALTYAAKWNGASWAPLTRPGGSTPANSYAFVPSVSCPTVTFCVAVTTIDYASSIHVWANNAWSTRVGTGASRYITEVSCSSSTRCAAVGNDGGVSSSLVLSGTTWAAVPFAPSTADGDELSAVSCATDGTCVAVGNRLVTVNGQGANGLATPTTLAEILRD